MKKLTNWKGLEYPLEDVLSHVGKGWRGIVTKLIEDLFNLGWNGELHQIKEKFGELRFYVGNATDEIFDRIDQATEESLRTCEKCGKKGKLRTDGWWVTLCDECDGKRERVDIDAL